MSAKIDVKILNPFFSSAYDVVEEMSGLEVTRGELRLHKNPTYTSQGFAVIIGVTGTLEGRVIIDMEKATALKFAEIMNMEDIGEFNELVKSSMGEIGNMISGRAISKLQDTGFDFNITPPTLFEGEQMTISTPVLPTLVVPIIAEFGKIEINLAFQSK
jgi:chemotaxis protein CheX